MLPDVSRETGEKLELYHQLLIKWQGAIKSREHAKPWGC